MNGYLHLDVDNQEKNQGLRVPYLDRPMASHSIRVQCEVFEFSPADAIYVPRLQYSSTKQAVTGKKSLSKTVCTRTAALEVVEIKLSLKPAYDDTSTTVLQYQCHRRQTIYCVILSTRWDDDGTMGTRKKTSLRRKTRSLFPGSRLE
jgi:hypothetical protein